MAKLIKGAPIDALALVPWSNRFIGLHDAPLAATVLAIGLASLVLIVPRSLAPALLLVVGLNFFAIGESAAWQARFALRRHGVVSTPRSWIDEAVGRNGEVASLWIPGVLLCESRMQSLQREFFFWQNEFLNRSIRHVYYVRQPAHDNLPARRLALRRSADAFDLRGPMEPEPKYLVVDDAVRLRAPVIAHSADTRTTLYRANHRVSIVPPRNCSAFGNSST